MIPYASLYVIHNKRQDCRRSAVDAYLGPGVHVCSGVHFSARVSRSSITSLLRCPLLFLLTSSPPTSPPLFTPSTYGTICSPPPGARLSLSLRLRFVLFLPSAWDQVLLRSVLQSFCIFAPSPSLFSSLSLSLFLFCFQLCVILYTWCTNPCACWRATKGPNNFEG